MQITIARAMPYNDTLSFLLTPSMSLVGILYSNERRARLLAVGETKGLFSFLTCSMWDA
jgi:hypothetical protein